MTVSGPQLAMAAVPFMPCARDPINNFNALNRHCPAPVISDLERAWALQCKATKDGGGPHQLDETVHRSMRLSQGVGEGKTS